MKVLHIIMDGYSPKNPDKLFTDFSDIISENIYPNKSIYIRDVDIKEGHLRSPNQWTKCYSHVSFEDIKKEGDSGRLGVTTKIGRVPTESFIWNKLAHKGASSWIYPYGQYYRRVNKTVLTSDDCRKLLNGVFKMYGTKLSANVDDGKVSYYKSDTTYWGLHEASWNKKEEQNYPEFKGYRELWKNPTKEFIDNMPEKVHGYYKHQYSRYLNDNTTLLDKEILPHLSKCVNEGKLDNSYVHLALVETDALYHFISEYPDIVDIGRTYINHAISKCIEIYDPDLVILTGDHGATPVKDHDEYQKSKTMIMIDYKNYSGNKRYVNQSAWGISPVIADHSHDVGAVFYSKSDGLISKFDNDYFSKDKYLMYDIYNFICDLY